LSVPERLIVFDLDGTLLGADNRLSPYTAEVLARAHAEGLTLMAASGRSRWAAEMVLEGCPAIKYVICSNGATLWHRSSRRVVWRRTITPSRFTALHAQVNEIVEGACWAWETDEGIVPDEEFHALGTRPGLELDELRASPHLVMHGRPGLPIEQRLEGFGRIVRGLLAHPEMPERDVAQLLRGKVKAKVSSSSAIFLEVTAPEVHKAAMLRDFCARHGIGRQEVVAFGDHLNDLGMLRWAGRGIAMKGAYPEVLARIPEHTAVGHEDDGVAIAIEQLLGERGRRSTGTVVLAG